MDGWVGDKVVVVEDKDDSLRESCDLVEYSGQNRLRGRLLGRLEELQHILTQAGVHRLKGGNQVGPKAGLVIVFPIKGEPRCPV